MLDGWTGPIGLVIGYSPQYGVAQSSGPLRCLRDRGVHRGVSRHVRPVELVGTEPEDCTDRGFHVVLYELVQEIVAGPTHPGCPVDEVGGKRPVPPVKVAAVKGGP